MRCAAALRVEYGEIDAVRDRSSGQLYIVDVNPTPFGPPNHIDRRGYYRAIARMADAFQRAFL